MFLKKVPLLFGTVWIEKGAYHNECKLFKYHVMEKSMCINQCQLSIQGLFLNHLV